VRSGNGEIPEKFMYGGKYSAVGKRKRPEKIPVFWEISRMWRENVFQLSFPSHLMLIFCSWAGRIVQVHSLQMGVGSWLG
jgi:hypothetical protein